jgi:hypothetical protein
MILGIITFIYGLVYLIRGKGLGKSALSHPHFRLLGAFLLTYVPVQIVGAFVLGMVLALIGPHRTEAEFTEAAKVPGTILYYGLAAVYLVVLTVWEKAIVGKAVARAAAAGGDFQ